MEKKPQGIKLSGSSIGYSLGSKIGYSLAKGGYSLGKTGYSLAGPRYSAINIRGYASSVSLAGSKGYGRFSFKNSRMYGYSVKNNFPRLGMIDVLEEELKRYRKKRYDLTGMVNNHNYRFN